MASNKLQFLKIIIHIKLHMVNFVPFVSSLHSRAATVWKLLLRIQLLADALLDRIPVGGVNVQVLDDLGHHPEVLAGQGPGPRQDPG